MQQQQAAQAAVPAVVPSTAPDAMQLMLQLTQSIESLAKKVDGQQKSASREIPQDVRVAMEGALQGVADSGKRHADAMEVAKDALKGNQGSTLCGKNEHRTFGSGSDAQTNKADWMSRALDIPKENSDADAKFVKVTLPLPMRWKKRVVLSRDILCCAVSERSTQLCVVLETGVLVHARRIPRWRAEARL